MKIALLVAILLTVSSEVAMAVTPDKTTDFATSAGYGMVVGTVFYKFADSAGPAKRIAITAPIALILGLVVEIVDNYEPGNRFGTADSPYRTLAG